LARGYTSDKQSEGERGAAPAPPPPGVAALAQAGTAIDQGSQIAGAITDPAACGAVALGTADAGGGGLAEVAARFAGWDAVRARTGLSGPAQGSLPSRLAGFVRRVLRRVRDLGIAWDRERDLFAALVGELAAVEARIDELAVRQDALAMRLSRVAELSPRGVTAPATAASGSGGPAGGAARGPDGEAAVIAAATPGLTAGQLADLLAALERELPVLGCSRAVEVSIQGSLAEDLLAAANAHFGERMSGHGSFYRTTNDAWFHVDFTAYRQRPILFENAAARLAPGGYFVLVTGAPAPVAEPHPDLLLAAVRELSLSGGATQAPVLVMIWERR
jgi:hypothetical protein